MRRILCSTGTMLGRPNGRNYRLLPSLVPHLSCDGLEFMMYNTWYGEVDAVVDILLSLPRPIPMMHCEKSVGEGVSLGHQEEALRLFRINCDVANRLGAEGMVLHLWGGLPSDRTFENNLETYPYLAEIADRHGLRLLVENVVCNTADPMTRMRELRDRYPGILFTFDTKMAAFHGQLDLLYEEEYAWLWRDGHVGHYHVNDYGGGVLDWSDLRTLPIGKGRVDFDRFFAHIKATGYEGTLTVEATAFDASGQVDLAMLNGQLHRIRAALDERK